jgi:O-antigen biosynthesis protein
MPTPRFSILTPVYETPADVLAKMLRSVRAQSFEDWELCLVDDGSQKPQVREILDRAQSRDPRIRVRYRERNGGIVDSSNDALEMARGEFVALLDHDDTLHPDALAHVSGAIDSAPDVDYVYTDEDKIDARGRHSSPFLKPDWSPERMRTQMYTCHFSVLRRSLVEEVGGFDGEFEGSQDWDLILKVTERARRVVHVPLVLYHWRMLETSAAGLGEAAKPWAFEAGRRAVQAHCDRTGFPATVERDADDPGILHLNPLLKEQPLVSIVIPTAGQQREVRFENVVLIVNCVRSIVERSTYENYEIVVVVGEAVPPAVIDELREIAGERLRLVPFSGPFNFSAKINKGAIRGEGEQLLMLNDDIEITTPEWIERMVMYAGREGVGVVGGRLLWGDNRLQHVGVGFEGGLPGHTYRGFAGSFRGYANAVLIARDCLAVTGACLMTPSDLFEELGGLSLEFPVNFNDVDYCLKVHASGGRIVYDPDLILEHFESSSRVPVVEEWEQLRLVERWAHQVAADPYGNPNLRHGLPRVSSHLGWAKRRPPTLRQLALLALLALAALGCLLGIADTPGYGPHRAPEQALDLLRLLATVALVLALLLGPGVVWRLRSERPLSLGFLPLPGLGLLIAGGTLAWVLAGEVSPRLTCFVVFVPVLLAILGALLRSGPEEIFDGEERRVLLVAGCVLGLAIGRALWSLGPEGELYAGTISRTLEVGDRSDSRISYHVTQLLANGQSPYSPLATALLSPYNFSSRGPLPGIGSGPIVLLSGGHPPAEVPEQAWTAFDPQGFMAYRLAMMTFACTCFLSLWDLVRRLAGRGAAYFGLLLAGTTPFLVHEVWFTWPKLLAASMVLLAAICVIGSRPLRGGLLAGCGYLMHPIALLSMPTLGLISLWPLRGASWRRPRIRQAALLVAGLLVFLVAWRLLNGSHYSQNGFLDYFRQAGLEAHPHAAAWLEFRAKSLGNTLVPLLLPLSSASNTAINTVGGSSPAVIHFFFQYWDTLPFGVAIVFFPLLGVGLWQAFRRRPWPVIAVVIAPFLLFAVYWGVTLTGMLREGLQIWVLSLFAVIACEQAARGFSWLRSTPIRALLALRVVEVLAMAMVPTIATGQGLISADFKLTDSAAVLMMVGFGAALAALVWRSAAVVEAEAE